MTVYFIRASYLAVYEVYGFRINPQHDINGCRQNSILFILSFLSYFLAVGRVWDDLAVLSLRHVRSSTDHYCYEYFLVTVEYSLNGLTTTRAEVYTADRRPCDVVWWQKWKKNGVINNNAFSTYYLVIQNSWSSELSHCRCIVYPPMYVYSCFFLS